MALRYVGQFLLVPAMALVAACSDTAAPEPVLVELVSGNWQRAPLGEELAGPLVVRVMDLDSVPRGNVVVEWSVTEGAGVITAESSVTDEEGLAKARWTLGPDRFGQVAKAWAVGAEPVLFDGFGEPEDWLEVLEITAVTEMTEQRLLAHVVLENQWAGSMWFRWYSRCLLTVDLFDASGAHVSDMGEEAGLACPGWGQVGISAGGFLYQGDWWVNLDSLEPGEYTVRYTFHPDLRINGRSTLIPDIERTVVIG